MQTDIFLQKALVDEVKDILKGYTTLNNGEPVKFNVYPQNLPAKKGKNGKSFLNKISRTGLMKLQNT